MNKDLKNSVGIVEAKTIRIVEEDTPLQLACGKSLGPIDVAYETYGKLNDAKDNAIYVCHALTGNAHLAGYNNPNDKKPGWWECMVGPGKYIDTDKYFVVCSNFLGGCSGTTGPTSINPATGKMYALDFPIITIKDQVRVQKMLVEELGIKELVAVIGGSMGGMNVLQWSVDYPDFIKAVIVIASTTRLGPQSIAFDAVGRNAILADPKFNNGNYTEDSVPASGLSIARMIGHITYLSEEGMRKKFGRELRAAQEYKYEFQSEFSVETYLDYQGQTFVDRFDANSYLYITKAMDYFDLAKEHGSLQEAFKNCNSRFFVISFSSDWLFTPAQSEELVNALVADGKDVSYCNIESPCGHDAFLLEFETLGPLVQGFIDSTCQQANCNAKKAKIKPHTYKKYEQAKRVRVDHKLIESLIEDGSRVLDIGCGNGELLVTLENDKNIRGEGIELNLELITKGIENGISIIQRDIERGLSHYEDKSFDYVLLSHTLQTLKNPEAVYEELLRVGKRVIVSFPNFAHWRCRLHLLLGGKAPATKNLPFRWYNSPNIHFLSLKDFDNFCKHIGVTVEKKIPLHKDKPSPLKFLPNLLAPQAIYVTRKD